MIRENPIRWASFSRLSMAVTVRSSPSNPISPQNAVSARTGMFVKLLTNATATAKSAANQEQR
jgi:hypothetical protein